MPRTTTVEFAPTPHRRPRATAMEDNIQSLTRRPTIDTIASENDRRKDIVILLLCGYSLTHVRQVLKGAPFDSIPH